MWNDTDIEMAELYADAAHAEAQAKGREATEEDIQAAIAHTASSLRWTGGESSFRSMMEAIEDRPDVAWTAEVRERVQLDGWERFELLGDDA